MNGIEEIVHIIPLGHEFERAVKPFDTTKANRVYLIVDTGDGTSSGKDERDNRMQNLQEHYTEIVSEYLKQEKQIDVTIIHTKTFDLPPFLTAISKIIEKEKQLGSRIHINMSASGRLAAVAATIAGMAHNIQVYYVVSDRFAIDNGKNDETNERYRRGISICEQNKVLTFTNYQFIMANEVEVIILQKLSEKKNGVSASNLVKLLEEHNVKGFERKPELEENPVVKKEGRYIDKKIRNEDSRKLMLLNHSVLAEMIHTKKYIEREKVGREVKFKITPAGEYALHLSGKEV